MAHCERFHPWCALLHFYIREGLQYTTYMGFPYWMVESSEQALNAQGQYSCMSIPVTLAAADTVQCAQVQVHPCLHSKPDHGELPKAHKRLT